jgi:hypothetical protein
MMFRRLQFERARASDRWKKRIRQIAFSLGGILLLSFCSSKPVETTGLKKTAAPSPVPTSSPSVIVTPTQENRAPHVPVLAYYYIWFDTQSWDRAKTDYPILGRYSSDDADVMRKHIEWAKDAGIDGFIVSWKGTEKLKSRLDQLVAIAEEENFKLAIIYEGLNFERNPLPVEQINSDLGYFIDTYSNHSVFDLFGKPMVIWSGSWEYSPQDIASVVQDKREHILVLASEKNVEGYQRLSGIVDGDAYYWSSVNPDTHPGYLEKLTEMGDVIHEEGGLWIAPAAPGFDARLVGGDRVVDRDSGNTLQKQLRIALQSSPDAIGLISWNEFSENSHIEPSQQYGFKYIEFLSKMLPFTTDTP